MICAMQSLGVLLFYLCFQTLPFEGDCKLQVLHWLFAGILTSVSCNILARTGEYSGRLHAICARRS